jgi:sugar lactone lactonase YvrE
METGLTIANGMGWSPDGRTFYLTDTLRHTIYAYDYVADSGLIHNRRVLIHDPDEPGLPDGLAVDSAGFLWSARWGGWMLRRYDPDDHLERRIEVPVECPSSCAFGGPELNELYITSAWTFLDANQRAAQPFAGDLFRIRLDVPGMSANQFGDRR